MVFKFFKGIADAIREGIEEGKEEARQEAAQAAADRATQDQRFAALDPREKFYAALAAPLRRLFIDEAPYYLGSLNMPEGKETEVAKYLERDFDVTDGATLEQRVADLELPAIVQNDADRAILALRVCRIAYMVSAAAGLRYITRDRALALLAPVATRCADSIDGWTAYAALYLEGEKLDGTNHALGRKLMATQVARVQEEFWPQVSWGAT